MSCPKCPAVWYPTSPACRGCGMRTPSGQLAGLMDDVTTDDVIVASRVRFRPNPNYYREMRVRCGGGFRTIRKRLPA